jgi:hypothetical protein
VEHFHLAKKWLVRTMSCLAAWNVRLFLNSKETGILLCFIQGDSYRTGSIANTQLEFRSSQEASKISYTILGPEMPEETIANVWGKLLQSPKKSLQCLSQETGYSYSTCQRAAKKVNLRPYKITTVQELGDVDKDKRVWY